MTAGQAARTNELLPFLSAHSLLYCPFRSPLAARGSVMHTLVKRVAADDNKKKVDEKKKLTVD